MGVHMYGKIHCEMWHCPPKGRYPCRTATNRQLEMNRCLLGKLRALVSNLVLFLAPTTRKCIFLTDTKNSERVDYKPVAGTVRLRAGIDFRR